MKEVKWKKEIHSVSADMDNVKDSVKSKTDQPELNKDIVRTILTITSGISNALHIKRQKISQVLHIKI